MKKKLTGDGGGEAKDRWWRIRWLVMEKKVFSEEEEVYWRKRRRWPKEVVREEGGLELAGEVAWRRWPEEEPSLVWYHDRKMMIKSGLNHHSLSNNSCMTLGLHIETNIQSYKYTYIYRYVHTYTHNNMYIHLTLLTWCLFDFTIKNNDTYHFSRLSR